MGISIPYTAFENRNFTNRFLGTNFVSLLNIVVSLPCTTYFYSGLNIPVNF